MVGVHLKRNCGIVDHHGLNILFIIWQTPQMLGGCFPQINGKRYQYNVNDIEQPKGNQD
jgi:hypothetical protein